MRQCFCWWLLGVIALSFEIRNIEGFATVGTKQIPIKNDSGWSLSERVHSEIPRKAISGRRDTKLFCVESVAQRNAQAKEQGEKRQGSRLFSSLTYNEAFASVDSRQKRTNLITLVLCLALVCTSPMSTASIAGNVLSKVQKAITWYSAILNLFPIVTKSVTAGVIGALGDYMAQRMEHGVLFPSQKRDAIQSALAIDQHQLSLSRRIRRWFSIGGLYDGRRGLSIMFDGLFISGPLMHLGYDIFESILPVSGGGTIAALAHVVADTLLLDSIFVATTIWVTGLFEGYSVKETFSQFRRDYVSALKAGGITSFLVLPLELVCFRFLPISFRVLAVNFIDIIWDAVISHFAHKSRHHESLSAESVVPSLRGFRGCEDQKSFEVEVVLPPADVFSCKGFEPSPVGLIPAPSKNDNMVPAMA